MTLEIPLKMNSHINLKTIKCEIFFLFLFKCWLANSEEITTTFATTKTEYVPTFSEGIDVTLPQEVNDDTTTQNIFQINENEIESRGFSSSKTSSEFLPLIKVKILSGLDGKKFSGEPDFTIQGNSEENILTVGEDFNSTSYLSLECITLGNSSFWVHDGLEIGAYSKNFTTVSGDGGENLKGAEDLGGKYNVKIILGVGKGIQERDSGNFSCVRDDEERNLRSSVYIFLPDEQKPKSPCEETPCGLNSICEVRHGNRSCNCLQGYVGNADVGCRLECSLNSDCAVDFICVSNQCIDPCVGACGSNTFCQSTENGFNIPECKCLSGYEGDPNDGCVLKESGFRFERTESVDLCSYCGTNADCISTMNQALICRCKRNLKGDPYSECKQRHELDPHVTPCANSPCGQNAYCEEKYGRAICHCQENFYGDPWTKCHAECLRREHCKSNEKCIQAQCRNACDGACGEGANCTASNHVAICTCPENFNGDPHRGCFKKS